MANKLKIILKRSRASATQRQVRVLVGLNLRKINSHSVLEDTPAIRGMIAKVEHMVRVEPA